MRADVTENKYNIVDSLSKEDFISFDEFNLKWRFTEEKYNRLPAEDLVGIQPLSESKSTEFNRYAQTFLGNASLLRSEFSRIELLNISDDHEAVRDWLWAKKIYPDTKVVVSWDKTDCVITSWRVFCKYWDDFCYPGSDDILVWSSAGDWLLYYCHNGIFEYGTKNS
jgi:hypothetical protein